MGQHPRFRLGASCGRGFCRSSLCGACSAGSLLVRQNRPGQRASLAHEKRLAWLIARPKELAEHADAIVKLLRDGAPAVRKAALEALAALTPVDVSPHGRAKTPCATSNGA